MKIWDYNEQKCVDTLKIRFKSLQIEGKTIEFGVQTIYPGPKRISQPRNERSEKNQKYFSMSDIIPVSEKTDNLCTK